MSFSDYFITVTAKQHYRELVAQAERDRMAAQLPRRRSWLRRLVDRSESALAPVPEQSEVANPSRP